MIRIGILAIQGDFDKHREVIERLGHKAILVRTRQELQDSDGLIIPGGESSTLVHLLNKHDLKNEIIKFSQTKPIYGTCAGLIILANKIINSNIKPLGLLNLTVERNAYGRQIDSFIDNVRLSLQNKNQIIEGVFIRAPKIHAIGERVRPLGWHGQNIVLAEEGMILVSTFHPELSDQVLVHEYFCKKIKNTLNKVDHKSNKSKCLH
jgi:5'-phosphate synthase pdxT subunit